MLSSGCPTRTRAPLDPILPEQAVDVPAEAPGDLLSDATTMENPSARARALGLLIAVDPEDGGGSWGPRGLFDPDAWVQRASVLALAERVGDPDAEALLEAYTLRTGEDPYVRGLAARSLPSDRGLQPALEALRAESEPWRIAPLALAAAVHGDPGAVDALGAAVGSGELALEVDFMLALGASGLTQLLPALKDGSDRAEPEMELAYAAARLMLGEGSAEQAFRKALASSDVERRMEALDYLSAIDDPASTALLRRARNQGPEVVRWYADLALAARSGSDPDAYDGALQSDDPEVRALGVRFAAQAGDHADNRRIGRAAQRAVELGLEDADQRVRIEAVRAAVSLGLDGERGRLEAWLVDEALAVRIEAAGALLAMPSG